LNISGENKLDEAGMSVLRSKLSAVDQAKIAGLNATAQALVRVGVEHSRLTVEMADQIAAVERETSRKVVVRDGLTDGTWFVFDENQARRGREYIKVYKPNEVRLLSARLDGVIMSANFMKPGFYDHENHHVAQALRRLADAIEKSQVRLADCDVDLGVG
jgi:hypothetical protein